MGSERAVPKIPVVEFPGSWDLVREEVRKALEKYGCFELVYNKYSIENHNSILEAANEFFSLPDEIKTKHKPNLRSHGYAVSSSISSYAWIVDTINEQQCQNFTRVMWPNGNQHFCESIHSNAMLLAEVQELVVKMLFESYGLDKDYIVSHLKSTKYRMHLLQYEGSNQAKTNVACMDHTDKSFLSILHQNVKGLQVRLNDGEDDHWISYQPSSHSSFIILASDGLMGWSNDRIKSSYHRVMLEGEEVRYSIGFFGFIEGMIKVPKELIDEKHPLKYKPFNQQEYLEFYNFDPNTNVTKSLKVFCGI
ncbi:2-oxoglutarate (2OG) and Fe(II)-dependent oxygenase superfamily protein [Euphorbia peplus]|nr:2-oxoglutarate (2OG) and Fe(II)-dependent oxygenase superfamily protein [Euphorbia peplus]